VARWLRYNSPMSTPTTKDFAATLNGLHEGRTNWATAMGVAFVRATADEVVAELEIGPQHHQPFGIVHGGVHAGLIETVASVGAGIVAVPRGQTVVGLENHTTFVRAARSGRLRVTATPLSRGRTTQIWEATVRDDQERVLATGRVRLLCIDAKAAIAGGSATSMVE
jgi:1,4-dihydroxy-2-naphthoyl-CoA hydrolase